MQNPQVSIMLEVAFTANFFIMQQNMNKGPPPNIFFLSLSSPPLPLLRQNLCSDPDVVHLKY